MNPLTTGVLSRVLPELRVLYEDLPDIGALAPDREAARLFSALGAAVETLASPRPLLIVFEDLHWASAATLDAIAATARHIDRARVLIVGTYREEEAPAAHPLRRLLNALGVEQRLSEIYLGRFDANDARRMIAAIGALAEVDAQTVARLYAFSEGNALFLNEAIADALESGSQPAHSPPPTRGVESIVAARVARLSEVAQTVAEIAAVCGQGCSVEIVCDIAGLSAPQALDALNELLDRRLVREAGARDRFDFVFTHHLIGASIYARMKPGLRTRRHARIAHIIESRDERDVGTVRELARHYHLADRPEQAARWYTRAAREAVAVYANEDAVAFASLALDRVTDATSSIEALLVREEANARLGEREAQARDLDRLIELGSGDVDLRCRVLRRRALLLRATDERDAERQTLAMLHAEAAISGDRRWQSLAATVDARFHLATGQYAQAKEFALDAVAEFDNVTPARERIEALASLIEAEISLGELEEAERRIESVQAIANEAGDHAALAETLMEVVAAATLQQQFERAITGSKDALEHYCAIGDRVGEARALANIATAAIRLSRWEEARAANLAAVKIFEATGDRWGLARAQMNLGMLHARCGDLDRARELISSAREHHTRLGDLRARTASLLNESFIALWQGRAKEARDLATEALAAAQKMDHAAYRAQALANLGAAERDLGELDSAIAHMDEGLALQLELGRMPDAVSDLADAALAHAMYGDLRGARELANRILGINRSWTDAAIFPPFAPWTVACILHWSNDDRASEILAWASQLATSFAASIDAAELRTRFQALPFVAQIRKAESEHRWPPLPRCGTPRARSIPTL